MGILKEYEDGFVIPALRFNQIENRNIQLHFLMQKKMVGYVIINGAYIIVFWENERYYKSLFAKNRMWFDALAAEPQFQCVKSLPQIVVI